MSWITRTVRHVLRARGYRVAPLDDVDNLEPLLYYLLRQRRNLTVVQIGANDGRYVDPVFRFVTTNPGQVRLIAVEPIRDLFDRLVENYKRHAGVTPINAAIHNTEREMVLWRVDPAKRDKVPSWAQAIASFDPQHHKRSNIPTEYMQQVKVACLSLSELIDQHSIRTLDVLQIDTEGYDAEIVRGIDFTRLKPAVIHFEHGLPDGVMTPDVFLSLLDRLRPEGYEFAISHYDATAYQRSVFLPR